SNDSAQAGTNNSSGGTPLAMTPFHFAANGTPPLETPRTALVESFVVDSIGAVDGAGRVETKGPAESHPPTPVFPPHEETPVVTGDSSARGSSAGNHAHMKDTTGIE